MLAMTMSCCGRPWRARRRADAARARILVCGGRSRRRRRPAAVGRSGDGGAWPPPATPGPSSGPGATCSPATCPTGRPRRRPAPPASLPPGRRRMRHRRPRSPPPAAARCAAAARRRRDTRLSRATGLCPTPASTMRRRDRRVRSAASWRCLTSECTRTRTRRTGAYWPGPAHSARSSAGGINEQLSLNCGADVRHQQQRQDLPAGTDVLGEFVFGFAFSPLFQHSRRAASRWCSAPSSGVFGSAPTSTRTRCYTDRVDQGTGFAGRNQRRACSCRCRRPRRSGVLLSCELREMENACVRERRRRSDAVRAWRATTRRQSWA